MFHILLSNIIFNYIRL